MNVFTVRIYCTCMYCDTSYDKCTYCKSLCIKASAKRPKCKCNQQRFLLTFWCQQVWGRKAFSVPYLQLGGRSACLITQHSHRRTLMAHILSIAYSLIINRHSQASGAEPVPGRSARADRCLAWSSSSEEQHTHVSKRDALLKNHLLEAEDVV